MLLKPGVDISRLNRPIRRTLNHVDLIYKTYQEVFVITSTYSGDHSPGSLHYSNDAYDCRLPSDYQAVIFDRIREKLGPDFDVVKEKDHYHIEYDPKG